MSKHFGGISPARHNDRARLVVVLSVACVLLFTVIAFVFLNSGPSNAASNPVAVEKKPEMEMVAVLVPVQKIEPGVPLEPSMFRKETRPKIGLTGTIIRDFEEIKGFYSRSLIVAEQPLHADYITQVKPTNTITANIPEGYRAVTIRVDVTSSVEGWARAGAHVDVLWTSTVRGRQAVSIIVQNVKILSAERQVDQNTKAGAPVPSTVTLLVTAQDAQKIQLAQTAGNLSLSLRGDNDPGKHGATGGAITIDSLLGGSSQEATVPDQGIVKIGGEEYQLIGRKLVPVKK